MSEKAPIASLKITGALLDPQWGWGKVMIDGHSHRFIVLQHPLVGPIHCLLDSKTLDQMVAGLALLAKGEGETVQ